MGDAYHLNTLTHTKKCTPAFILAVCFGLDMERVSKEQRDTEKPKKYAQESRDACRNFGSISVV